MYESFYGLSARPFELNVDSRFVYLTPKHREALSNLEYAFTSGKGTTLLLGEAGTGKTTITRMAMRAPVAGGTAAVYVNNPALTRDEFLELVGHGLGLSAEAGRSKARFLIEAERLLTQRSADGVTTALIVDEAQALPDDILEEIRLLGNVESADGQRIVTVLVGQPELGARLNRASLCQLKQRIALRCVLGRLDAAEVHAYIETRIAAAGGGVAAVFAPPAIEAICAASRGIPRTISVICDNALATGFALHQKPVALSTVMEVCRDFDLSTAESSPHPSRPTAPLPRAAAEAAPGSGALPLRKAVRATDPPAHAAVAAAERPHQGDKRDAPIFTMFPEPRRRFFSWS
jgi:general secretion pathway protein A